MLPSRQAQTDSAEYLNEYSGYLLEAAAIVFLVLNTVFVALRFYARNVTKAPVGWDDLLIVCGYVVNIGLCATGYLIVQTGGVGYHKARVMKYNPTLLIGWAEGVFAVELLYLTAVALPKISVLFMYLRIFTSKPARYLAQGTIALVTANWISFFVAAIFQCKPVAFWWDRTIEGGTCFDVQTFYRVMCVPNIVTDLIVMSLPISTIIHLNIPTSRKAALTVIFLTASIGVIASVIRFSVFFRTDAFSDSTWESVPLVGWSIIEGGMYLVAACLPLLRPVFAKHSPVWLKRRVAFSTPKSYKLSSVHRNGTKVIVGERYREGSQPLSNKAVNGIGTGQGKIEVTKEVRVQTFEKDEVRPERPVQWV